MESQDNEKEKIFKELVADDPDLATQLVKHFAKLPAKERAKVFKEVYRTPLPTGSAYFHEKYALQLLPDLQYALLNDVVIEYRQEDYPAWTLKTVYLYVTHAFKYVVEFLDDDQKTWKKYRSKVQVCLQKEKNRVLIIPKTEGGALNYKLKGRFIKKEDYKEDAPVKDSDEEDTSLQDGWKNDMFEWMELAAIGNKYEKTGLKLTEEEVKSLEALFENNDDFGFKWTSGKTAFIIRRLA